MTISIGLALSTDFAGGDVDEIVQEADEALYSAKRAGRNCVRVARRSEYEPEAGVAVQKEETLRRE